MLQKEFEERIGRSVSQEEFTEANAMCMAAGEMDKDEFCHEWKQVGQYRLVQCLFNTAYNLNKVLHSHQAGAIHQVVVVYLAHRGLLHQVQILAHRSHQAK